MEHDLREKTTIQQAMLTDPRMPDTASASRFCTGGGAMDFGSVQLPALVFFLEMKMIRNMMMFIMQCSLPLPLTQPA